MPDYVQTSLAILAALLMLGAMVLMARGQLLVAGVSFLAASMVIYIRETRG